MKRDNRYLSGSNFVFDPHAVWIQPHGRMVISEVNFIHSVRRPLNVPPPFFPDSTFLLERPRPDWRALSGMVTAVSPSGWVDLGMRREIEAQFTEQKNYTLVDSAEAADLVLLVEGLYYSYWDPEGDGRMLFSVGEAFMAGRQLRQAAVAVLVPSEAYRHAPADGGSLLQAATWTGCTVWRGTTTFERVTAGTNKYYSTQSASIKELMSDFFKRSKWNSMIPPVYPAWSIQTGGRGDAASGGQAPVAEEPPLAPLIGAGAGGRASSDALVRTETVLVTVPVTATDVNDRYVPDLNVRDFHLYEDGVEQKIDRLNDETAPLHVALSMDCSHSAGLVRADIESAALTFLESLRPDDELMALSMGNVIYVDSEFTQDRSRLRKAITGSMSRALAPYVLQFDNTKYMGTRLYDAVDLAITERLSRIGNRKAILLFTDGVDIGSRLATAASSLARIEESEVLAYAVKYDTTIPKTKYRDAMLGAAMAFSRGGQYLQDLASRSGGRVFNATKGADLAAAFSHVADELRHHYTLCYYPSSPLKVGSFRRIEVRVDRPGIKLRARPGYRVRPTSQ